MTLIDTNVLLDLVTDDPNWADCSVSHIFSLAKADFAGRLSKWLARLAGYPVQVVRRRGLSSLQPAFIGEMGTNRGVATLVLAGHLTCSMDQ